MSHGTLTDPMQCIELSDDDDEESSQNYKKRRVPTECLNVECQSGEEYLDNVPAFIMTFYKVRKKKGLKVCRKCFEEACAYFSDLRTKFMSKESIYNGPSSKYKPVLNIDSDEEDLSPDDDDEVLDSETVDMVETDLTSMMRNILSSDNFHFQVNDACSQVAIAKQQLTDEFRVYHEKFNNFQKEIDEIRRSMYECFQPILKQVPDVEVDDVIFVNEAEVNEVSSDFQKLKAALAEPSDPTPLLEEAESTTDNELNSSQDVVAVSEEILMPPGNLPPAGSHILRAKLKPGDIIFAMKHSYKYAWKKGCIVNISRDKGYHEFQIKIDVVHPKKNNPSIWLPGKSIAYPTICQFRFVVGTRVIAMFKDEVSQGLERFQFYSGTVAEPPKVMNKFRYLIFFDDGCAQYVSHEHIRLICEPSPSPWDDIPAESKDFIKKYLLEYPERPMVKLQVGNIVKVEYQSAWLQAKVMEVDGSLAKMFFLLEGRIEWIYRGSSRLAPLFKEFEAARRRLETGVRTRRVVGVPGVNSPYVEYTHNVDGEEAEEDSENVAPEPRAVAKKSTASASKLKPGKPLKWAPLPVPGEIQCKQLKNVLLPRKFVAHQCGPTCIRWTNYDYSKIKEIGPLAIPLHFGYRRVICHFGGGKRNVMYKAPCGRSLRNMEEVHMYLRITKSAMTVDFFDYDYWVNCLSEFVIHRANVRIDDITQKKENVPISCVNYIDNQMPACPGYLTDRAPRDDVSLNLDPEFLCGCDCTDDCQDREKCSCWQLTIEGQKLIPNNILDPNVGYHYRRLPERVITGIYECNQQCKCSKETCLNRVVQYPLTQKLQLFKTQMKGWGIRCLNDIPQGAFICVYAGHLLTEHEANEEGKNYGDEYLAELDYIEVIERIKEDYESDVPEDLDDDLYQIGNSEKSGSSYRLESPSTSSDESTTPGTSNGIKTRLRERKSKKTATRYEVNSNNAKKKEKKKEFVSIRKYFGENDREVFIMDAKGSGNIGRYLNHSCMPNVFVQNVFVDTHDLRFPWVAFFAQTYILAGTELTWDYNYEIGSVEGKIKYCYCGSSKCRGRLL